MTPVESKVKAGTAAAAASGLVLWVLGRYVFKGDVPDVVASWVYAAVPAAVTFAAGYLAHHSPRSAPPVIPAPAQAQERGGYSAGGRTVSDLPPPPPSVSVQPPPSVPELHAPPVAPPPEAQPEGM